MSADCGAGCWVGRERFNEPDLSRATASALERPHGCGERHGLLAPFLCRNFYLFHLLAGSELAKALSALQPGQMAGEGGADALPEGQTIAGDR